MAQQAHWTADTPAMVSAAETIHNESVGETELRNYMTSLENIFVELRGRGIQWSTDDRDRARAWCRGGVPLATALHVIDIRARGFRFLHGNCAALPPDLRFYEKALQRTDGLYRTIPLTATSGPPQSADSSLDDGPICLLLDLVDALPSLLDDASDPALIEAYKRALRSMGRMLERHANATTDEDEVTSLERVEKTLSRCRGNLVRTLLEGLGPKAAAEIEGHVDAELATGERMSKRATTRRRSVLVERELAKRWGLRIPTARGWIRPGE